MEDSEQKINSPIAEPHTVDVDVAATTMTNQEGTSLDATPIATTSLNKDTEPTVTDRLRQLQDATLKFLANATNETLGACAVGLCASTYLVLGRVGLVLIGAVGGVVLHASWEGNTNAKDEGLDGRVEAARKRKELGLEVAKRVLEWRDTKRTDKDDSAARLDKVEASMLKDVLDYSAFRPATATALTGFTDAVIRDYVKWWYGPILPTEDVFPAECRQILTSFIISFSNHVSRKRAADPFLDFVANSTSILIVFLNELSSAVRASPNQSVEDAVNTYLEFSPDSSLANVISSKQQSRKLTLVAEDILETFLDSKTLNCGPARVFLREVLAGLILQATVDSCSKAEWINGWIVYLLEDGEPELMNVIDAGVEDMSEGIKGVKKSELNTQTDKTHKRRISKAEEAMEDAMREAQRINEMIAEEEARRKRGDQPPEGEDAFSSGTTDAGVMTPSSSDSDRLRVNPVPLEPDMVFDSEGNAIPSGTSSPAKQLSPTVDKKPQQFTSFDQLAPQSVPTALKPTTTPPQLQEAMVAIPLTLHAASITLMDMGSGSDRLTLKQKPAEEILVQIEPASSRFPGWMVTRSYPDFESLHETLRRIAVISGVVDFSQKHEQVPTWRNKSRATLITELQDYMKSAVKHERLAESEAMKKFLEKSVGLDRVPAQNKNVLLQGAAALDNVGKGFVNVLGQGGKGIAGGGKAVLGGVQGVFGAVATGIGGPKKTATPSRTSTSIPRTSTSSSVTPNSRMSQDLARSVTDLSDSRPSLISRPSGSSFEHVHTNDPVDMSPEGLNLPPPPSEISDEFVPTSYSALPRQSIESSKSAQPSTPVQPASLSTPTSPEATQRSALVSSSQTTSPEVAVTSQPKPLRQPSRSQARRDAPLTEEETRITVDLMFAIITSTYSLSSAWTFRLSLLSAAKTYILRPNNPQLDSIRTLLQESVIQANTSDTAIATHVNKLRENTLPTDDERAKWPKELDEMQKEELRLRARKLLVERGMPQALTSVMGQAASGEALGKVFDCLQIESVARGLIFAVMLQGLRAVMQ